MSFFRACFLNASPTVIQILFNKNIHLKLFIDLEDVGGFGAEYGGGEQR